MVIDKQKAIKGAFRIPEKHLFFIAAAGGSIGSIIGMYMAHHKTKHKRFTIGLPLILITQICILILIQ